MFCCCPQGFPQLVNELLSLLRLVDADRPVLVLLDGLDEFSDEHGAQLSWILTPLPQNVHLILSATTSSACTQALLVSAVLMLHTHKVIFGLIFNRCTKKWDKDLT